MLSLHDLHFCLHLLVLSGIAFPLLCRFDHLQALPCLPLINVTNFTSFVPPADQYISPFVPYSATNTLLILIGCSCCVLVQLPSLCRQRAPPSSPLLSPETPFFFVCPQLTAYTPPIVVTGTPPPTTVAIRPSSLFGFFRAAVGGVPGVSLTISKLTDAGDLESLANTTIFRGNIVIQETFCDSSVPNHYQLLYDALHQVREVRGFVQVG